MPHLVIEHSSDIKKSSIRALERDIQNIMASITEGNFDPDQCKARSFSFDEYLVGKPDESTSSFLHITIKILSGRTLEVRKILAQKVLQHAKELYENLATSPSKKDKIIEIADQLVDAVTGIPHPHLVEQNSELTNKRCDISVDIVEMDRDTYQKIRLQS